MTIYLFSSSFKMVPCKKCGVPVWVYTCHTDRSYWAPTPARNLVLNCIVNSEQVLGQLWGTKIVSNISTLKMFTVTVWNMIFVISIWQCQYLAAHQLEISYAAKLNFQWCLSNLYPFLLVCFDDRIILLWFYSNFYNWRRKMKYGVGRKENCFV